MQSKHLVPFAAGLRKHGQPVRPLLKEAGLPSICLDDPSMLVPPGPIYRFRELSARRSGDPNLALTATRDLDFADLGDFGRALLKAPTLHRLLSEFRRLIFTQTTNVVIDLHTRPGGQISFGHRFLCETEPGEWQSSLYMLTWMLKLVRLVDPAWSPNEIWLRPAAAPTRFEAVDILGSAARFGQDATGFLVPESMLALPLANRSTPRHGRDGRSDRLWSTAPARSYTDAVQQLIRSYASDGWLSLEQASEAACTSVRSLQRRLALEQQTFSRLLGHTRAEMAGDLLETTDAPLSEIAGQLGYTNQGNFTRAFRRWAGVSPSEFRRRRRPM